MALFSYGAQAQETIIDDLNSLIVAPEYRCSYYRADDYWYPQRIENAIIARDGLISPYTMRPFSDKYESTIEHIVARSEAHDSGLCDATINVKLAFAQDLDNLALATQKMNRDKSDKDVADWIPPKNVCWFVGKTIQVRKKYNLTIDAREKARIEEIYTENCYVPDSR